MARDLRPGRGDALRVERVEPPDAQDLEQIGVPCLVLEAVREMRPLGVGINLQPNAVRELGDLGIGEDELDRVGVPAREWALVGLNGNDIYSEPRGRAAAVLLLCGIAAGCAASGALRRGQAAERRQDYDLAVVEFTKAVRLHPDDTDAIATMTPSEFTNPSSPRPDESL